jgi:tetratricopeptide (TPR) repeat protein
MKHYCALLAAWGLCSSAAIAAEQGQYLQLIEQRQEAGGLTAPDLVEPLDALGDLYFSQQDYDKAFDAYASARQVMRVNDGFDTLPEIPLIAKLVRTEEARGRVAEAWALEQALLTLGERYAGSIETLEIFQDLAARRLALWRVYNSGSIPPQIELGCYYNRREFNAAMGALLITNDNRDTRERCTAGDRPVVQLALLIEARSYQMRALEALLQNGGYASDPFWEQFTQMLDTSYRVMRRARNTADTPLANMMVRLLSYEPRDAAERQRRAHILVQLADMNVVRARQLDRYVGFDAVREQYEQAYAVLQQEGLGHTELQEIFAPALPVTLPSFSSSPLATDTAGSAGFIDVSFEITRQGKTRRVKTNDASANVERAQRRALERTIGLTTFRPRVVDGRMIDNAPVSLRYYISTALRAAECGDDESQACVDAE